MHLGDDKSLLKSEKLKEALSNAKKPLMIVGLEAFKGADGVSIHAELLEISNKFLQKEEWNGFNVLHQNASLVSGFDAKFIYEDGVEGILEKVQDRQIKVVYALGADEIDISKLKDTLMFYNMEESN